MITSPKLEERYIVLKIRDLKAADALQPTREFLRTNGIKTIDCVVVEADWPQYSTVVDMIIPDNAAPKLPVQELAVHIKCETESDKVVGTTSLNVVRVERNDDGSLTAVTDYWPTPTPVTKAVVMPNRMTDGAADYAYARYSAGWNACLDEVARLNGGKPNE